MSVPSHEIGDLSAVPLFPLPNVVHFPGAMLPLHIFEERYRVMIADALHGDGRIAMATLLPGWEKEYSRQPAIQSTVCVGQIVSSARLADGRYNLMLQGALRATVVHENRDTHRPYRVAELRALPETRVLEIDLTNQRQRLIELINVEPLASNINAADFQKLLNSPLSTVKIADLLAFHLVDDLQTQFDLLREPNVIDRVDRLIQSINAKAQLISMTQSQSKSRHDDDAARANLN